MSAWLLNGQSIRHGEPRGSGRVGDTTVFRGSPVRLLARGRHIVHDSAHRTSSPSHLQAWRELCAAQWRFGHQLGLPWRANPGLVSISPYSPPFALLVQVPPVLVQTSSVLLGIPVSLHGKLDGLWEGFHGVAGWLWPAFGVVGSLEMTGL